MESNTPPSAGEFRTGQVDRSIQGLTHKPGNRPDQMEQAQVEQDQVEGLRAQVLERFGDGGRLIHIVLVHTQRTSQRTSGRVVVIDDEDSW